MESPHQLNQQDISEPEENVAISEPEENVLVNPDEITDVILEVEGRELHASRAVLAHYSPVFRVMFYSHFKESSACKVPLPGKDYKTMVMFYNVLFPRSASAKCLIDDNNLIQVLTLADEYQTDQVKVVCQSYIGEQLNGYFHNFYKYSVQATFANQRSRQFSGLYDTSLHCLPRGEMKGQKMTKQNLTEKLILYLWACDEYHLPSHRPVIKRLLVDLSTSLIDITQSRHYSTLSDVSRVDILEALCSKFEGSRN